MGIWDDITGVTAQRNAAKGLERYGNQQADLYADRTRQQFGDLASQHQGQQADALGNVNAWLDPSIAYQQAQGMNNVLGAFGGSGKLNSGATQKALFDRGQAIGQQGFQQAMDNYMRQQGFNNQVAQQNFSNNFQTANMQNQADATRFNAATQGRANVASIQGPSAWDAFNTVSGLGMKGLGTAAGLGWKPFGQKANYPQIY